MEQQDRTRSFADAGMLRGEMPDLFKSTPLHGAIRELDLERARALLDSGADVNARAWYELTPLMEAVQVASMAWKAGGFRAMLEEAKAEAARDVSGAQETPVSRGELFRKIADFRPDRAAMQSKMREERERKRREADSEADLDAKQSAADEEAAAFVRVLIERGADVEARDQEGGTALSRAASEGSAIIVRLLLDTGAAVDAADNDGLTPLMHAATECQPAVVTLLLERGAHLHARTQGGGTALMAAARGGSRKTVSLLLERGAEVNAESDDGSTALLYAAMQGYADVVELLRSAGARVGFLESVALGDLDGARALARTGSDRHRGPSWGRAVMLWAATAGRADVIRFLREHGASANVEDKHGSTPLMRAVMRAEIEAARALLEAGAEPSASPGRHGFTPLCWAASWGSADIVRLLLERGADVNLEDEHGTTALQLAVSRGHHDVARMLLDAGANVESGMGGFTPLGFAAIRGDTEMVKLLVEHGADGSTTRTKAGRGLSAEHLPGVKDDAAMLALIRKASGTEMHVASKAGDNAAIERLLAVGRDVNAKDERGHTPLQLAAQHGHGETVEYLLSQGADPRAIGAAGMSPLQAAIVNGHLEIARALIQSGSDLDQVSEFGLTALMSAAMRKDHQKREALTRMLLEAGARVGPQEAAALGDLESLRNFWQWRREVDEANAGGVTPLMAASAAGQVDVLEALLAHGADSSRRDSKGRTALIWAAQYGREDAARRLLDAGAEVNLSPGQEEPNGPEAEAKLLHTPLEAAIMSGNAALVRLLLERGADPTADLGLRGTMLHLAVMLPDDKSEIVRLLLDHGANLEAIARTGDTPLVRAAEMGHVNAVSLLLQRIGTRENREAQIRRAIANANMVKRNPELVELLKKALGERE